MQGKVFAINKKMLQTMVNDVDHRSHKVFSIVIQSLIIISLVSFSVETIPDLPESIKKALRVIETTTIMIFTAEYILRFILAEKKLKYVFSFYGIIDLLAILPFYISIWEGLRFFRLFRLLRLLKLFQHNPAIDNLVRALALAKDELLVFGFVSLILLFLSAVGIYYFENAAQPDAFKSIPHSLWWAIITLTTVGYGDVYPITVGGKFFTFIMLAIGLGIVAMPTGIIASALSHVRSESKNTKKKSKI